MPIVVTTGTASDGRLNRRYRLLAPLGAGAEGEVWLGEDEQRERARRAIKVVRGVADEEARARLAGEFRRLAALAHRRLVAVYDLETADGGAVLPRGTLFFTADYVDGVEPGAALLRGPPAARPLALITIAEDVAEALAHVHAAGLVHHDVKPDNIVVDNDGRATLLDLGLGTARAVAGVARGTLAYMAPEALAGDSDPRADLYALGATLYHAAAGRPPFVAPSPSALVRAILDERALAVEGLAPWLPAPLAALIMKLLAPRAAARHSSALVLLEDLARVRESLGYDERALAVPGLRKKRRGARGGAAASAGLGPPPPGLLPPPLVEREAALAALDAVFTALAQRRAEVAVIGVGGAPGVGKTRLIEDALRRQQLKVAAGRQEPITVLGDRWERIWRADPGLRPQVPAPGREGEAAALCAEQVAKAVARLAADRPVVVHLADAEHDERSAALVALLLAGEAPGGWLVVAERGEGGDTFASTGSTGALADASGLVGAGDGGAAPSEGPTSTLLAVPLSPLSADGVAALVSGMLGRDETPSLLRFAHGLARATGGVPRLVVEAVRAASGRAGVTEVESLAIDEIAGGGAFDEVVRRRVAALGAGARILCEALSVWCQAQSDAPVADLAALAGLEGASADVELGALAAKALVDLRGGRVGFPSSAHAQAIYTSVPAARRQALHRAARARLEASPSPPLGAVARHAAAAGRGGDAAALAIDAARLARELGDLRGAYEHAADAARLGDGALAIDALLLQAELGAVLGRYDEALTAARKAAATRDGSRRRRAEQVVARVLARRGDLDGAAQVLTRVVAEAAAEAADEECLGQLARLDVARAKYAEALAVVGAPEVEPPTVGPVTRGRAERLEATGLAALYSGDLARADRAFTRLAEAAAAGRDPALGARAHGLLGMLAHARGQLGAAAAAYGEALAEARAAGDVHGAAAFALNRAAALMEQGAFGEVLGLTAAAIRDLRRLGGGKELPAALFNRGTALCALGDLAAARRAAVEADREARARGLPQLEMYAAMLSGDVARREGQGERALSAYDRAEALARERGAARERVLADLARAEVLAELGRFAAADEALARAQASAAGDEDEGRIALCRARVGLAKGQVTRGMAEKTARIALELRQSGRTDQAWRAELCAARLWARLAEPGLGETHLSAAQKGFSAIVALCPEARREGLRTDPDACALAAAEAERFGHSTVPARVAEPGAADAGLDPDRRALDGPAASDGPRVVRLLRLAKRLNSELRLERLLDDVIDAAVELSAAERGFLLLYEAGGPLSIRVARNIDQRALEGDELALSRSIAERAASTGEPVLTVDASGDDRFGGAASVGFLRLRSVLCVPLAVKGRVVGALYLDHRFRRAAFDDDAKRLLLDLADIAAVALDNAQLVADNERRRHEIVKLNERLEERLRASQDELDGARAQLAASGGLELRYAYDALVGRSPRMLELLRLLDRATATSLPVVIHGESGTGKELVARALHENGARKQGSFVSLNCGAVPESLLEAELFGHVRGAFTGADRDRRGLFEVADGGTLFLDEIADTSPAMQTKLLRALQEGEVRRVGGDRPKKVDVRIVAASNRDLRKLVAEGKFREDLFYRLHVVRIDVPALRERSEDIPALAAHVLSRLGERGATPTVKRLDRAALARLVAYPWPGNVRELENELARAAALGGEVIGVADLSPPIAAADPLRPPPMPEDLAMRPRVEHLERSLLREALGRTQGNQTAAARLLGLSRFGLQKKLRRYGL
jgi:transcriptional regulator with GAF, ATPase, and Fis domain